MDARDLAAYCRRIGYAGDGRPTIDTAAALLTAQLRGIPFENLDPYLGREVSLALPALVDKLVHRGRGGYCYEHNLLFAAALRVLGMPTTGLAARVCWAQPADAPPRPRTHMLLRLDLDGVTWLLDAGFGAQAIAQPLRLGDPTPVPGVGGPMRLLALPAAAPPDVPAYRVQWYDGAAWLDLYTFDLQPQQQADHEMSSWFLGHHPASMFRRTLMAARCEPDGGRIALRDGWFSRVDPAGTRHRERIATPEALAELLAGPFGIALDGLEGLPEGLARAIAASGDG